MKSKRTILELSQIFQNYKIYEVIYLLNKFKEGRDELKICLNQAKAASNQNFEKLDLIERLNDEISYANKNIATLTNALLCHETKIFETRNSKILGTIKIPLN